MKKVLMIAYYFPPLGGAGVQRPLKFAIYLPEFGWNASILTLTAQKGYIADESLLNEIKYIVDVHRARSLEPNLLYSILLKLKLEKLSRFIDQWLFIPDNKIGWIPFSLLTSLTLLKKKKFDIIWTTSPPFSAHFVGFFLKKMKKVKWIMDFRTEWSKNPYHDYPTEFHRTINRHLEERIIKPADAVITLSLPHTEYLKKNDRNNSEKYFTVENGYDEKDMKDIETIRAQEKFRISYTGSFYGHQNPWTFLKAIEEIKKENLITEDELEISIIGNLWTAQKAVEKSPVKIKTRDYMSHREIIQYQHHSDLLFLELDSCVPRHLPGKIYEYMRSGTPILAIVPENGIAAKRIKLSKTGVVVKSGDVSAARDAIVKFYKAWKTKTPLIKPNWKEIEKYERRNLTRKLVKVFESV